MNNEKKEIKKEVPKEPTRLFEKIADGKFRISYTMEHSRQNLRDIYNNDLKNQKKNMEDALGKCLKELKTLSMTDEEEQKVKDFRDMVAKMQDLQKIDQLRNQEKQLQEDLGKVSKEMKELETNIPELIRTK